MIFQRSAYVAILVTLAICILSAGTSAEQNTDCGIVIRFGIPIAPWPFTLTSRLLFQEDFAQPHGWNAPRFWPDPFRGRSIMDESLHIMVAKRNWNNSVKIPVAQSLHSFILETDVRSVSASRGKPERYGIRFHYKGSGSFWTGYYWRIQTDGVFEVYRVTNGHYKRLLGPTFSYVIRQDRQVNHLRLVVSGHMFLFEINGVRVAALADSAISTGGQIRLAGATLNTDDPYCHIAFDNVRLFALS